jgi:uncharacterized integral membrane protein
MKAKTIIVLILIGLFLVILLQNTQVVTFQLLFWEITMSRILLILIIMIIGFGLGYILGRMGSHGKRSRVDYF